jgi:hypothetical protein
MKISQSIPLPADFSTKKAIVLSTRLIKAFPLTYFKKLSAPTRLPLRNCPLCSASIMSESESGLAGLQIETRLPGGTLDQPSNSFKPAAYIKSGLNEFRSATREQPRRTASFLQSDDPFVYYYLAWASPPLSLDG